MCEIEGCDRVGKLKPNGSRRRKCHKHSYNQETLAAQRLRYARKLRTDALAAYGGRCTCCGELEPVFLAIDHIDGDGANHRLTVDGGNFYQWLRSHEYPANFQILCMNCNWAKSHGGCPHNLTIKAAA